MAIPGFSKVSSERLRKNRGNFGIILLLWGAFVVYTVIDDGEVRPSAWFAIVVVVLVLAVVVASEVELRRRAAVEAAPRVPSAPSVENAPTVVVPTPTHLVEWPDEVHHDVPPTGRPPVDPDAR